MVAAEADRPPYDEVDVSDWKAGGEEPLGTKQKGWLICPNSGHRWLFKHRTFNSRSDGTSYAKGDDWAERVAFGVAQKLGLPAAVTELAVVKRSSPHALPRRSADPDENERSDDYGVLSRSVTTEDEFLVHGSELLANAGIAVGPRNRGLYTVAAMHRALQAVHPPASAQDSTTWQTAWQVMSGYLVLDALIGNTDRHKENWSALQKEEEAGLQLAPTFDHASSLGFMLDDLERQERLRTKDHGYTPEAYADKGRTRFAGKPHPVDVVVEALDLADRATRSHWREQIQDVDGLVEPVAMIPGRRMSKPAREFAELVLRRNWQRLVQRMG